MGISLAADYFWQPCIVHDGLHQYDIIIIIIFTYQSSHSCAILFCKVSAPSGRDINKPVCTYIYIFQQNQTFVLIFFFTFPAGARYLLMVKPILKFIICTPMTIGTPWNELIHLTWVIFINCKDFADSRCFRMVNSPQKHINKYIHQI